MTRPEPGAWQVALALLLALSAAGCFQLETVIRLNTDGSVTVTERLQFSEELLDLGRSDDQVKDLAHLLTREAALDRMKQMGKGIELVSHEIRETGSRARESVAVYRIPDLNDLTYVSPYLARPGYPQQPGLKCRLWPVFKGAMYENAPGRLGVSFTAIAGERRGSQDENQPPPPSPASLQAIRDLEPLFRDMMDGVLVRITFESYAPLIFHPYYRVRGKRVMTKRYDLIDFDSDDLDNYGSPFLENQEAMLDLMRVRLDGADVIEQTKNHPDNPAVPVYYPTGARATYFAPSRELFDRHFKGKTLQFDARHGGPRLADFDEVGYRKAGPRTNDDDLQGQ